MSDEFYLITDNSFIKFIHNLGKANIPYAVFKSYQYRSGKFSEKDLDIYIDWNRVNEILNYLKDCKIYYENPLEKKIKLVFERTIVDIYTYIGKKGIVLFSDIRNLMQKRVPIKINDVVIYVLNPIDDFYIRCILLPFEVRLMNFNEVINALKEDVYHLLKMKNPYQLVIEFIKLSLKTKFMKTSINTFYTVMKLICPKIANLYAKIITKNILKQAKTGVIANDICFQTLKSKFAYTMVAIFAFSMITDIAGSPYLSPNKKIIEICRFILKVTRHFIMIIILDLKDTLMLRGKILW